MELIIGIILVIIVLFIIGSIMRKRIYDAVDRLESWKISIMDRDVAAQLSRIKALNLLGETLEKFEVWKTRWDDIITKDLLEIEEYLFDAEHAADRFRFTAAKKVLHNIEQMLKDIERDIDQILAELDELLHSEEDGREEITTIEPGLRALRRQLSQRRYQFGKAEAKFDQILDDLEKQVKAYHASTESGDYLEAREIVSQLQIELKRLSTKMEEFPEIYKAHRFEIPQQIEELKSGMKDMIQDGYRIEHLQLDEELHKYEERLQESLDRLDNGETDLAKALVLEINERIKEIYDALEKEAIAKSFIESQLPGYETVLNEMGATFAETKDEVEAMKQTYYFEDRDLEKYLALEKMITHLRTQLTELQEEIKHDDKTHLELREELEQSFVQLEELKEMHEAFRKRVYNLRKDEIAAKEKLSEIGAEINSIRRKLLKSNLPGVPNYIWTLMDQAAAKCDIVMKTLDKQPLDITEVQESLENAESSVANVIEETNVMLDQAHLTEQVIQYANRYRSRDAILAAGLIEAERLFRKYEYELALEQAVKTVEKREPGALKRIEQYQDQDTSEF